MRVLVLFEVSGVVRDAFLRRGHDAYSCDYNPTQSQYPTFEESFKRHHYGLWEISSARDQLWDLLIAHPACTDLAVSGALRFKGKEAQQDRQLAFIKDLMTWHLAARVCIENPVSIISSRIRKPDQIIQPYQFGHDASKKTCLWLHNLPPLQIDPSKYVKPRLVCKCGAVYAYEQEFGKGCPTCGPGQALPRWENQTDSGQNRLPPSKSRAEQSRGLEPIQELPPRWRNSGGN